MADPSARQLLSRHGVRATHRVSAPRALASVLALAALLLSSSSQGGELQKASNAVHSSGGSSQSSGESSTRRESSGVSSGISVSDDSDGGSFFGSLFAYAFFYTVLSPFWLPRMVVEEGPEPEGGWSLASHPYADGTSGYFEHVGSPPTPGAKIEVWQDPDAPVDEPHVGADHRRVVGLQLGAEGMPPVAGIGRLQLSARFQTAYRFELDAAYALYLERGDIATSPSAWSGAWLGHAHAAYQFARGRNVQFRAGLGMRHWADAQGTALGVDFLYGVDIFWGHPVTTSLEFTCGSLGNAWVVEPRGTLGFVLGVGEIFAGYDAIWIGGSSATAYLGGPVVGMRAYF